MKFLFILFLLSPFFGKAQANDSTQLFYKVNGASAYLQGKEVFITGDTLELIRQLIKERQVWETMFFASNNILNYIDLNAFRDIIKDKGRKKAFAEDFKLYKETMHRNKFPIEY